MEGNLKAGSASIMCVGQWDGSAILNGQDQQLEDKIENEMLEMMRLSRHHCMMLVLLAGMLARIRISSSGDSDRMNRRRVVDRLRASSLTAIVTSD